jgi:hypothetical protein
VTLIVPTMCLGNSLWWCFGIGHHVDRGLWGTMDCDIE